MPKVDAVVQTPKGPGTVVCIPTQRNGQVKLDNEQGADIEEYHIDNVKIVRMPKRRMTMKKTFLRN